MVLWAGFSDHMRDNIADNKISDEERWDVLLSAFIISVLEKD